uniref:Uncharacterized protein n=1 Tax=Amphora coffeiformis TaxID=265554 RepID=A0A7S3L1E6_9STRA
MSGAPKTEDYEEDVDYVGGDDDDDDDDDEEDEDDFVPGVDEDHHEEEEDEDDIVPLLDGYLYMDAADHSLHYQGDGFHLNSSEPPAWNVLETSLSSSSQPQRNIGDSLQVIMTGPCDFESEATAKATPRKMKVTFTVVAADSIDPLLGNLASRPRTGSHGGAAANGGGSSSSSPTKLKSDNQEEEDDEDAKKAPAVVLGDEQKKSASSDNHNSKAFGWVHRVFGQQMDTRGGDTMEFVGVFYPSSKSNKDDSNNAESSPPPQVSLTCQVRMIPASATPPTPVTAAAAAAPAAARIDKSDDDDEDEEYEQGVDYDELIALHEDAGMSVDALQKRYRDGDTAAATASSSGRRESKRTKKPPPSLKPPPPSSSKDNNPGDDDDNEDDDDYGF